MAVDVFDDHFRNFRGLILDQLALGIQGITTRAGGPVVVQTQRQLLIGGKLLALVEHRNHPIPHRAAHIYGDLQAGEIIIVIVLDNGHQETASDLQLSGFIPFKILCTAFQGSLQNLPVHQNGFQCIGEHIGRDHIPDGNLPVKALYQIAQAGNRQVRAGGIQLDLIKEIGNHRAIDRHFHMLARGQGDIQFSQGLVKKNGVLGIQRCQERCHIFLRCTGIDQLRMCRHIPLLGHRHIHTHILLCTIRRLAGMGTKKLQAGLGLVLMACQQHIKIQLLTDAVGLIFPRGRQKLPGFQIIFKPAMVDTDGNIHIFSLQFLQRRSRCGERFRHSDPG